MGFVDPYQDEKNLSTKEHPMLNELGSYKMTRNLEEENITREYDAMSAIYAKRTHIPREEFDRIFNSVINFYMTTEAILYEQVQRGEKPPQAFLDNCEQYLKRYYSCMHDENDFNAMMDRIKTAVFKFYVIQPLIDLPDTSDIKICAPDDIRVRVGGKAYQSNAKFINSADLTRFVSSLAIRNYIAFDRTPVITFTDDHDDHYKLRFTISTDVVNAVDHPYLHIRKIPKDKPDFEELIKRGMLDENIRDYLIDRAEFARGVIFAGPPGSGKTTALNAWIEYIPRTRETLVIQENDELHTKQKGFMFKHVTHGFRGEPVCTLEDLGRMALVEGCNEFIIGEAKGGEMRSILTLLNSGGHGALTLHSNNVYDIIDKGADLVKYGSTYSFEEAKRMMRAFDTLVYMEDYKVRDILEVSKYNDQTKRYEYHHIYHRG